MVCVLGPYVCNRRTTLSKGNTNWKDTIVKAMNGSNTNTDLLKLARAVYKAGADKEPDHLSSAWLGRAAETAKWALTEAGVAVADDRHVGQLGRAQRVGMQASRRLGCADEVAPRVVVARYCFDAADLASAFERVERAYVAGRVQPGTSVGVLAAQSTGAPATQMTLNSTPLSLLTHDT